MTFPVTLLLCTIIVGPPIPFLLQPLHNATTRYDSYKYSQKQRPPVIKESYNEKEIKARFSLKSLDSPSSWLLQGIYFMGFMNDLECGQLEQCELEIDCMKELKRRETKPQL